MQIDFIRNSETIHRVEKVMTPEQLAQLTPAIGDQVELPIVGPVLYVQSRRYRYGKTGLLGIDVLLGGTRRSPYR